jgi:hypothetical protein
LPENIVKKRPNGSAKSQLTWAPIVTESERELGGLLRLLMGAVPAIAAVLLGVGGPVEGRRFSVKKHGLLTGIQKMIWPFPKTSMFPEAMPIFATSRRVC